MTMERLCPHCESPLIEEDRPYSLKGFYVGRFMVMKCSVCQRIYHPKETSEKIEMIAREKGMWGIEKEGAIVRVTGNTTKAGSRFLSYSLEIRPEDLVRVMPPVSGNIVSIQNKGYTKELNQGSEVSGNLITE